MKTLPTDNVWRTYGKKSPYFGVFGTLPFTNENLTKENKQFFFDSGFKYTENLFSLIYSKIDKDFKPRSILDYGCGPGRMVIPFSSYTKEIVGIDISEDMLKEAEKNCDDFGVNNATFYLANDNLKFANREKFDLIHSFIVLQHLRVKRGEKIIKQLIDLLAPGGIGVLHITYNDSLPPRRVVNFLRFRIPYLWFYLRYANAIIQKKKFHNFPQMQMNNYNLNRIFSLLQQNGIEELVTRFTNHYEYWGCTLFFQKPKLSK